MKTEMEARLRAVVPESIMPDFELKYKLDLAAKINQKLARTNSVALLHNYMEPVLYYAVNGIRGDSLELSKQAARTSADRILFCGVVFMAETAKILSPAKRVIVPSLEAGCSLADGCNAVDVQWYKEKFPNLPVITYVNSYAAVKAETDVCCTSGNVMRVVEWAKKEFKTKSVIFLPDKYMAGNIARDAGMKLFIPDRQAENPAENIDYQNVPTVIGMDARCYVHEKYRPENVRQIISTFPDALIIAHPECPPDTLDEVFKNGGKSGSTSEMLKTIKEARPGQRIAMMTECSLADNALAQRPELGDTLIRMCNQRCKFMKTATMEDVYTAIVEDRYEITVSEEIRRKAEKSVRQMLEI
ncbi:hypothetical protein A2872_00485 [Candidatus Gottesmanbacteria bacterium RIFCSPHIGHO2_01_FULL_42_12]|uniref:quinolinate synthase n=1 Tax=Candidatus Gottesmanbacteria bacterium RIFCSPHIGHO2_01_FULL_42_12 TaxID=1798377 RepID=A0A1F5Z307_9BACT|nr:MAG: hypothetical protein A2872_00485 [Candidatus Gottesmanbacteria bacterium RIFCSPHIGHO2_01_FULL_42_12]